jgi:hypothetical protein
MACDAAPLLGALVSKPKTKEQWSLVVDALEKISDCVRVGAWDELKLMVGEDIPTQIDSWKHQFGIAYGALRDAYVHTRANTAPNRIIEVALNKLHEEKQE